jgi:hypothetical protein
LKIAYLCGSPKKKSTTQNILDAIANRVGEDHGQLRLNARIDVKAEDIAGCDALVIAFPLYVDCIPSHLLGAFTALEGTLREYVVNGKMTAGFQVYAVVNSGFAEPEHNEIAIEMIKIWCAKTGLAFGGAIALGGGGIGPGYKIGRGPTKSFGKALRALADEIKDNYEKRTGKGDGNGNGNGNSDGNGGGNVARVDDRYVSLSFPRSLYIWGGNYGWRKEVRKNGLPKDAIYAKPGEVEK